MAWPKCPHCGAMGLHRSDTAHNVMPGECQTFRSYECPECKKILWTEEHVFCDDAPTTRLRRKFGPSTVQTV